MARTGAFPDQYRTIKAINIGLRSVGDDEDLAELLAATRALVEQLARADDAGLVTKSSIMLGLGESEREVDQVMDDLRAHDGSLTASRAEATRTLLQMAEKKKQDAQNELARLKALRDAAYMKQSLRQ